MEHAKTTRRLISTVAMVGAVGLALVGCSSGAASTSSSAVAAGCEDYASYGTFADNPQVSISSTILDTEADNLVKSWADFEKCTGITVKYTGSKEFETQILVQVQGNNAPDLAIFPQPGLLATVAQTGKLVAAPDAVSKNVDTGWSADWKKYGTIGGTFYASPLMASVKGYIWYSPKDLKARGIAIPTTLDELMADTKAMAAASGNPTGYKPWCAGFNSGDASGWPGTDWIEDYVLRQSGPDVYDQWIAGKVKFSSPEITKAFNSVGDILLNNDYVNGGIGDVKSINSTTFNDGGLPILKGTCSFHHQASFYEAQWPTGTKVAQDGDVYAFLLPGTEAGAQSVTGGGEFVGAFNSDPATVALQTYLSSSLWANNRVKLGGVISANKGLDVSNGSSAIAQQSIKILQDPNTTFRFDASDLMPAAVGSNSFWKGIVSWINGTSTADVTKTIDSTWPAS